jgi:cation diffusion facilitator CzcD-associated flavoprotein CzcO
VYDNHHQSPSPTDTACDTEILVVGAGVSGIGMAIKLKEHGFNDFIVLEKAGEVGGTWRDHTYPGLTVDIPCLTFSYSFEPRPDWSSIWAPQREVLDYLQHCARKYDVYPHIRFREEVADATFDAERGVWSTSVRGGRTYTSRYLINASGYFTIARMPDIPGLAEFQGEVVHSWRWRDDLEFGTKRVAFIGTGATGIQLAPELAPVAERLHVFQRTPIWLLPKPALKLRPSLQRLFASVPALQRIARWLVFAVMDLGYYPVYTHYERAKGVSAVLQKISHRHIRKQVRDRTLQDKLTPDYAYGCKRPSFSNDFYAMFNRPNVELVTESIARIERDAIVTTDGQRRPVDVIICATGYAPFDKDSLPTYPVYGKDGTDLREYWDTHRYQAFRGFTVHGYPNFFLIFGPYTILGTSYFAMVEVAVRQILRCLTAARGRGANYIEVTPKAQEEEFRAIRARKPHNLVVTPNCATSNTYYIDRFGDTPGFRPWLHPKTWLHSRLLRMSNFELRQHRVLPSQTPVETRPRVSEEVAP